MQCDPLQTVHHLAGADEQLRSQFSMNDFAEEESGTNLDTLFYFWQAVRRPGRLVPYVSDFNPKEVFGKTLVESFHGVDVRPSEFENLIMLDHPGGYLAALHGGMTGKRISEFPSKIHARACAMEYGLCRSLGFPLYHEIDQIVSGYARRYRRLVLPLSDENGNIVQLGYAVRHLEPVSRIY